MIPAKMGILLFTAFLPGSIRFSEPPCQRMMAISCRCSQVNWGWAMSGFPGPNFTLPLHTLDKVFFSFSRGTSCSRCPQSAFFVSGQGGVSEKPHLQEKMGPEATPSGRGCWTRPQLDGGANPKSRERWVPAPLWCSGDETWNAHPIEAVQISGFVPTLPK